MKKERYLKIDKDIWVSIGIDYCRDRMTHVFIAVPLKVYIKYSDDIVKMIGLYSIRVPIEEVEELVEADVELLRALYE